MTMILGSSYKASVDIVDVTIMVVLVAALLVIRLENGSLLQVGRRIILQHDVVIGTCRDRPIRVILITTVVVVVVRLGQ
jgi:hypothetical protein